MSALKKITITREGNTWVVVREREENGETGKFKTLEGALEFVRIYVEEEHGREKAVVRPVE